jgi:hypothetical protein
MKTVSIWRRLAAAILAGIAVFNLVTMLQELLPLPDEIWTSGPLKYLPLALLAAITVSIIYCLRHRETHPWAEAIIRYWLAFSICTYGFAKIFHTQFSSPFHINDITVGNLNGFNLTWIYFGHSYTFAVIIAAVQISGAIGLLFRRTVPLAAIILLPVMVNIVLINVFYHIAPGAFINSVIFTLALLYLLTPYLKPLFTVLLVKRSSSGAAYSLLKYSLRILTIVSSFLLIFRFSTSMHNEIAGKWRVEQLIRDNDTITPAAILNWKNIYIETSGDIAFCSNPHLFDESRTMWGKYRYQERPKKLYVLFETGYSSPDTVVVSVRRPDPNKMEWKMVFQQHALLVHLSKSLR